MKDKSKFQKTDKTFENPKDKIRLKIPQNDLWAFIIEEYNLCLRWDTEGSFSSGITFKWRENIIHFKFIYSYMPRSKTITTLTRYKDQNYRSGVGRCAHGAGCFGKRAKMETPNHYLDIVFERNSIIIKDIPKQEKIAKLVPGPIFEVISFPNLYQFENRY